MGRHKKIVEDLDKLRERADEAILANEKETEQTIKWLRDILYSNEDMVALAAPQIGVNSRIFCIKFGGNDVRTFINPMIVSAEGMHLSTEVCANIPGVEYIVPRNDTVKLNFQNPTGQIDTNVFEGYASEVVQQMCQLLEGVLIDEAGLEILDGWYDATDEEREEVIDTWMKSINETSKKLNEEIENDEELSRLNKEIEFRTAIAKGDVEIEHVNKEKPMNRAERRIQDKIARLIAKRIAKKKKKAALTTEEEKGE